MAWIMTDHATNRWQKQPEWCCIVLTLVYLDKDKKVHIFWWHYLYPSIVAHIVITRVGSCQTNHSGIGMLGCSFISNLIFFFKQETRICCTSWKVSSIINPTEYAEVFIAICNEEKVTQSSQCYPSTSQVTNASRIYSFIASTFKITSKQTQPSLIIGKKLFLQVFFLSLFWEKQEALDSSNFEHLMSFVSAFPAELVNSW